jgi:hypothetical protein
MSETVGPRDGFSLSYALWSAACLLAFISSHEIEIAYGPLGFLVALLALPAAAIILSWMAFALARHLTGRRWRRVASILIGPPVMIGFALLLMSIGLDPTWLRFEMKKPEYLRDLAQRRSHDPRMAQWHWGDTGLAITASATYTIVFDESGQIALPSEQRSNGWRVRADRAEITSLLDPEHLGGVRKLDEHFYLVEQWFP